MRWFHWLIDNQSRYSRCGGEGSYGEMLLLAAIHFQEKRRSQILEMVSSTLGFSLQVGGAQGTPLVSRNGKSSYPPLPSPLSPTVARSQAREAQRHS